MNNNMIDILIDILRKRSVQVVLALVVLLLVAWAIVVRISQPPVLEAYPLDVSFSDSVTIEGDTVKVYNGNSFYSIDVSGSNSKKVLFTPEYRLPSVSTIAWAGEKGVLLNFKSGIMYTPVYDHFVSQGFDTTSDNYATWYLDFSTGELTLADENALQGDSAYYSKKDNGFYYVPDIDYSEIDANRSVLYFYNLETKASMEVVDDFNISIQSMTECDKAEGTVCFVGRKNSEIYGKYSIFAISKESKKLSTIYTHEGEVYQTPVKNTYLLLSQPEEHQGINTLYKKISILDIGTNQKHDYSGNIFGGSVAVGVLDKSLYVVDGHNNEVLWLKDGIFSGGSSVAMISSAKEYNLEEGISLVPNQHGNNVFVGSVGGDIYLLSTKKPSLPTTIESTKFEELIGECLIEKSKIYTNSERNYTILIEDNENFTENIKKVKLCIARNPDNLLGYTYTYKGFSSFNGRISTD